MTLTGKTAIVTGGARGIGRAIATGLASAGATVAVADVRPTDDAPGMTGYVVDVTDAAEVDRMVADVATQSGGVDILINNAALFSDLPMHRPLAEITPEEWRRVMDVNVTGLFLCSRAVVPSMRARGGGAILNISSGTFFRGNPYFLHYVTSKGAVIAFTRALAREVGPDGIRVNCIAPGFTMSEGVTGHPDRDTVEATRAAVVGGRAIARDQVPEDLVGAALFLCSPAAGFITGQTLVVDGGLVLH